MADGKYVGIDPRTLEPLKSPSDCHLIPSSIYDRTEHVRLEGGFDNEIGSQCDEQLRLVIASIYGNEIEGKAHFVGGYQSVPSILFPKEGKLGIKESVRGSKEIKAQYLHDALGGKDGVVNFGGWVGRVADFARAYLSILHSAMLLLYHQGDYRVFERPFDQARAYLKMAVTRQQISQEDFEAIREMAYLAAKFDGSKVHDLAMAHWRSYYDPNLDVGDGIYDSYPKGCISEENGFLVVRLPYSKSLRGIVQIRLN